MCREPNGKPRIRNSVQKAKFISDPSARKSDPGEALILKSRTDGTSRRTDSERAQLALCCIRPHRCLRDFDLGSVSLWSGDRHRVSEPGSRHPEGRRQVAALQVSQSVSPLDGTGRDLLRQA
ncbi:hypothetical protein MATL_G00012180 [Megalops atlanticus]|uniref:Uncharacterized protein n=1 Tax=Megalops atlanticus TaxID=7932 RepID=A0A9D3QHF8_MEGAT|nr:hypothetical protein MATL_G00012180 [Megalops atlanticus]